MAAQETASKGAAKKAAPAKKSAGAKKAGTTATKRTASRAPGKAAAAKKTAGKATAAKKSAATSSAAKKSTATTSATRKSVSAKAAAPKSTAAKATAAKSTAAKTPAKATTAKSAPAKTASKSAAAKTAKSTPKTEAVSPLSAGDIAEFKKLIDDELKVLRVEYAASAAVLEELRTSGVDGSGDDPADSGSKTFEREQEMSIAHNRLDLINQLERAQSRIKDGHYGICEGCGEPIPKARLQAYPAATLCVACKAREERR